MKSSSSLLRRSGCAPIASTWDHMEHIGDTITFVPMSIELMNSTVSMITKAHVNFMNQFNNLN